VTTLTVTGVGTYEVAPGTGDITFTAETRFTGLAPPVTYRVTDAYGQARSATYTVRVLADQLGVTGLRITGIATTGVCLLVLGGAFLTFARLRRRRRV
jgi:hypothetical protein